MPPRVLACLLFATMALAACSTHTAPRSDRMCNELARFANSATRPQARQVMLTTRWRPFEKGCAHGGYAPGARLCRWLLASASTERPEANVQRVMSCFAGAEAYAGQPALRAEYLAGKLVAHEALGVRENVDIGVEYEIGIADRPSMLKLTIAESTLE